MASRHSRGEGFRKVQTTVRDNPGVSASIIDDAYYEDYKGDLKLRGFQAGTGISINVVDADNNFYDGMDTDKLAERKIVISSTGALAGEIFVYEAPVLMEDQTAYPLPFTATSIIAVTINGLETTNWTFSLGPAMITLDLVAEGYGIDLDDEILIFYKAI